VKHVRSWRHTKDQLTARASTEVHCSTAAAAAAAAEAVMIHSIKALARPPSPSERRLDARNHCRPS